MIKYIIFLFLLGACETKHTELINPNLIKPINSNYQTTTEVPQVTKPIMVTVERNVEGSDPELIEESPEDSDSADDQRPLGYDNPNIPPPDDQFDDGDDGLYPEPLILGICGDGKRSPTEQCDDGNADNLDGCNILCRFPVCGNGVLEKSEWCDDANNTNGDGCNKVCEFERCGNGTLDTGEQCDDANLVNGDGCSKACSREVCGNSIIDSGEECDDGNVINGDGCSKFCEREICGDGVRTANEECDDGNHVNGDGCSDMCKIEVPIAW